MIVSSAVRPSAVVETLLSAILVVGCTAIDGPTHDPFWAVFQFGPAVMERTQVASLAELTAASDAVVVARISAVGLGREIHGDAPGDVVVYVRMDLTVERVLAGAAPEALPVEFLGGSPAAANLMVTRARAVGIPTGPVIAFLHEKNGPQERGIYRVSNSSGLWAATTRAGLDSPLRPEPPAASGLYADEIQGRASVAELIILIETIVDRL